MKIISIKKCLIAGIWIAAASISSTVYAHDIVGALTNGLGTGSGAGATDVYEVYCSNDITAASQSPSDHLFIQIRDDSATGGQVSATVIQNSIVTANVTNNTKTAISVTDLIPADGLPSANKILKAPVAAQDLAFTIAVHHTAAAADNYLVTTHCQDANSQHTGTSSSVLQNQ